jgi:hypothetical protein
MFYGKRKLMGVVMLGGGLNRDYYLAEARKEGYKVLIGNGVLLLFK